LTELVVRHSKKSSKLDDNHFVPHCIFYALYFITRLKHEIYTTKDRIFKIETSFPGNFEFDIEQQRHLEFIPLFSTAVIIEAQKWKIRSRRKP
jgi:hypothetical protein